MWNCNQIGDWVAGSSFLILEVLHRAWTSPGKTSLRDPWVCLHLSPPLSLPLKYIRSNKRKTSKGPNTAGPLLCPTPPCYSMQSCLVPSPWNIPSVLNNLLLGPFTWALILPLKLPYNGVGPWLGHPPPQPWKSSFCAGLNFSSPENYTVGSLAQRNIFLEDGVFLEAHWRFGAEVHWATGRPTTSLRDAEPAHSPILWVCVHGACQAWGVLCSSERGLNEWSMERGSHFWIFQTVVPLPHWRKEEDKLPLIPFTCL